MNCKNCNENINVVLYKCNICFNLVICNGCINTFKHDHPFTRYTSYEMYNKHNNNIPLENTKNRHTFMARPENGRNSFVPWASTQTQTQTIFKKVMAQTAMARPENGRDSYKPSK